MTTNTVETYMVASDHYQPINPLNGSAVVKVLSGGTVYYADQPYVTATTNQGSIAVNASHTFTTPAWLRSASLSSVSVTITGPVDDAGLDAAAVATAEAASVLRDGTGMPANVEKISSGTGTSAVPIHYDPDPGANGGQSPNINFGSSMPNAIPGDIGVGAASNISFGAGWRPGGEPTTGNLGAITTGYGNAAFGPGILVSATTGYRNNCFSGGDGLADVTTGHDNCAFGNQALTFLVSGNSNCAFGNGALANATGTSNDAFGWGSLGALTTGIRNAAFGLNALTNNVTANDLTAVGWSAGLNLTNGPNTAVGSQALQGSVAGATNITNSVAVGYQALKAVSTANGGTAVGTTALTAVSTGGSNTGIGNGAGASVTTGAENVIVGASAGASITTGAQNTIVGTSAGSGSTVNKNLMTLIGRGVVGQGNGCVAIGVDHNGTGALASTADYFVLGTTAHKLFIPGLPSADPSVAGQLYTAGAPSAGVPKAVMVSGG